MSVTIHITMRDLASRGVDRLQDSFSPEKFAPVVGPGVKRLFQNNFLSLGKNKKNWPTTNFWPRAAKATQWEPTPNGLQVVVDQIGVRQRFHGGEIKPVKAGALTIPISQKSYGKTAKAFPGLFLLKTTKGAYLVRRGEEVSPKGGVKARSGKTFNVKRVVADLEFLFKLSTGVLQKADPKVVPPQQAIAETVIQSWRSRQPSTQT